MSQNALSLHTERDVRELVTAARSPVMCPRAADIQALTQRVYTFY